MLDKFTGNPSPSTFLLIYSKTHAYRRLCPSRLADDSPEPIHGELLEDVLSEVAHGHSQGVHWWRVGEDMGVRRKTE